MRGWCGWGRTGPLKRQLEAVGLPWEARSTSVTSYLNRYCAHQDNVKDNTVHSTGIGWTCKGTVYSNLEARTGLVGGGFTFWRISDMALWLYSSVYYGNSKRAFRAAEALTDGQPIVSGLRVVDANIGLLWSNQGEASSHLSQSPCQLCALPTRIAC